LRSCIRLKDDLRTDTGSWRAREHEGPGHTSMTDTPDLNIAGSPIYENLVALSGDPYQPPAYQLPDVYGAAGAGSGAMAPAAGARGWDYGGEVPTMATAGSPAMLTQLLGRMLGDGQSWVAVLIFGGPVADQLRYQYQTQQQSPQFPGYPGPG